MRVRYWTKTLVLAAVILLVLAGCQEGSQDKKQSSEGMKKLNLRTEEASLTLDDILLAIKEKGLNYPAENIKGTVKHTYEEKTLEGIPVVIDLNSGLMWQQSEDSVRLDWREIEQYIAEKNSESYGGFSDWRLPTVEELLSLLQNQKKNGFYLDPLFEKQLLNTWSLDVEPEAFAGAWFVSFAEGEAVLGNRAAGLGHVRLVRTIKQ